MIRQQFCIMKILVVMAFAVVGIRATAQTKSAAQAEPATGQAAKLNRAEVAKIRTAVAKPEPVTIWAVTMQFTGAFDSIGEHMKELEKEIKAQNLRSSGVRGTPVGLVILLEEPKDGSARMAVGVQVPGKIEVKPPLKSEELSAPQAVRFMHVGSYEKLEQEHREINNLAKKAHSKGTTFPVVMRVLDDPSKVGPDKTRIQLVEKLE